MKINTYKIYNSMTRAGAEAIISKVSKITNGHYSNIKYLICPAYGSFDIYIESDYGYDSDVELLETFNFILLSKIGG